MAAADALSRVPNALSQMQTVDHDQGLLASTFVQASLNRPYQIDESTAQDPIHRKLSKCMQEGWPQRLSDVDRNAKPFYHIRSELYKRPCLLWPDSHTRSLSGKCTSGSASSSRNTRSQELRKPGRVLAISKQGHWSPINSCEICQSHRNDNPPQPLWDRSAWSPMDAIWHGLFLSEGQDVHFNSGLLFQVCRSMADDEFYSLF